MSRLLATLILLQQFPPVLPPPPPFEGLQPIAAIEQNGEGVLQGIVSRVDTGEGLRDVVMRLNTQGLPGKPATALNAITDSQGKFEFKNLPLESYTLSASLEGYFTTSSNGMPVTEAQTEVRMEAARKTVDVAISLTPGGVITGSVRDAKGAPLVNTPVGAMRLTYSKGHRSLSAVKFVTTDDRGAFRLAGLPPGDYYIRADAPPTPTALDRESTIAMMPFGFRTPGSLGVPSGLVRSISPTYAPSTSDPQRAVSLKVRGGDVLQADIEIPQTSPVRISGKVLSRVDGSAQSPLAFLLIPRDTEFDEGTASIPLGNVASDQSAGHFEVIVSRPGSYDLVALVTHNTRTTISAGRTAVQPGYFSGRFPVDVADKDIEGIQVAVGPGSELEVRYNESAATAIKSAGVGYVLRSMDAIDTTPLVSETGAGINPDGRLFYSIRFDSSLKFESLPEGRYQIEFPSKPTNTYVSEMKQGGRSVYTDGIFIVGKTSAEPLDVVFSPGAARVSGKIQGAEITASRPARMTLVPQGLRHENPMFYVRGQSAVDGTFSLTGIAPGDYKLYAFEVLPVSADENAAFMSEYESSGRVVTVRENSIITDIFLPLIRSR
jgi:hypothetical protein